MILIEKNGMKTTIILIKTMHHYSNSFDLLFIINSYSFKNIELIEKF